MTMLISAVLAALVMFSLCLPLGWTEIPTYSFRVPSGWDETPVSIADLGGTEVKPSIIGCACIKRCRSWPIQARHLQAWLNCATSNESGSAVPVKPNKRKSSVSFTDHCLRSFFVLQIDVRFVNHDAGALQIVVAPVARFVDIGTPIVN